MSAELSSFTPEQRAALARVRLFVLDVDGTLTDGRVSYVGGEEAQSFCVRDGQGLVWLRKAGVALAWISGRGCEATQRRAKDLGVEFVRLRCKDKRAALQAIQDELGISAAETIAMGDDLPDLALAAGASFFATPADGRPEVQARADFVTNTRGGEGAAREVCELCLQAKGRWEELVEPTAR